MTVSHPDRQSVEARMRQAKAAYTSACEAALRGDKNAARYATAAHREIEACREELRRLDGAALGVWGEFARVFGRTT